jgi:hypothetical protein
MRILLAGILLLAICSPAFADPAVPVVDDRAWLAHMAMIFLGVLVAMRLAFDAFARRSLKVADVPTFPRCMTTPQQFRLGSLAFMAFASAFFLLLVWRHKEVVALVKIFGEGLSQPVIEAVESEAVPYLVVVFVMGMVYLYCLTKEANWNVLLMMRDLIQSWISIPQLAGDLVAQIKFAMKVPPGAIPQVLSNSTEVVAQDFQKARNTPDRIWAETCYMKWWLTQRQDVGEDATFFTDQSIGFQELLAQFDEATALMSAWKAGGAMDPFKRRTSSTSSKSSITSSLGSSPAT